MLGKSERYEDKRKPLQRLFSPASVAVIGATDRPGSVGHTVLQNLLRSFKGRIYAVNSGRKQVCGLTCYASVSALPEAVDLVVIVIPAVAVPGTVAECVAGRVASVVVISAGFKEKGAEGAALEEQIRVQLRGSATRLIGPNCLGIMSPWNGLNATFAEEIARPGNVAFLSQSGALLTAILDWSFVENIGFSAIVSTGSMLDVGWGDLLRYFGNDPNTKSILLYMESIGNARSFLSAAREVSLDKPVIVIKAGRSEAAARAAASHTGAMTGSDEVYEAAFRRCGVLRVETIAELFHMADVLGKQPRPRGPHLTILTNAGGPGVLATDALLGGGGVLAELSPESEKALSGFLPAHWSHANPIDILGDADPERYARALDVALADPNCDGLLVILAPQGMTEPAQVAKRLQTQAKNGKPLLASWMGGRSIAKASDILNAAGIPVFSYPDAAVRAFQSMWKYADRQRALYETPFWADEPSTVIRRREAAREIIGQVAALGRTLLTELESKTILELYGIPTVPTQFARNEEEAAAQAEKTGYPVVVKLHSEAITHKSDVGGVRLNVRNQDEVREAYRAIADSVVAKAGANAFLGVTVQPMIHTAGYELIVGSSVDAQFGPVLLFGSGGRLVEVYRDRALGLPPLNTTLARRMMERTKVFSALRGVRGRKAIDEKALEAALVRFSELVAEHPRIREAEINPLLASSEGLIALDARIVLFDSVIADEKLPRPAIRPYPIEYIWPWMMKDGSTVNIRPIRAEDESRMVEFHKMLSDATVYLRYFQVQRLESRAAHERLIRKCFLDYDREMAIVAERINQDTGDQELLGVGRLVRQPDEQEAELAVVVADRWQRAGLGTELVKRLVQIARTEGIQRIHAEILSENAPMIALAKRFQFQLVRDEYLKSLTATLSLDSSRPAKILLSVPAHPTRT